MKTLRYDPTLTYDPEVEYLQICLNYIRKKFSRDWNAVDEDGRFGHKTKNALTGFQRFADLVDDGVAGDNTWASIESMMDFTPLVSSTPGVASRYSGGTSHLTSSSSVNQSSSKDKTPLYTPAPNYSPIELSSGVPPVETTSSQDSSIVSSTIGVGNYTVGTLSTATLGPAYIKNVKPAAADTAKAVSKGATKAGGVLLERSSLRMPLLPRC